MSSGSTFEQLMKVDAERKKAAEVDKFKLIKNPEPIVNNVVEAASNTPTRVSTISSTPNTSPQAEIAPAKNFHRVANSINKEAIEQGLFSRPSYKLVYDVLYLLTRGAIVPSRRVRISKEILQKKANIGSRVTLDAALVHLQSVGLVGIDVIGGKQGGNEYEVFLPEEATPSSTPTRISRDPSIPPIDPRDSSSGQILETLEPLFYTPSSTRSEATNIELKGDPKTSLKTLEEKTDDEPAAASAEFTKVFDDLFRELTGKGIELRHKAKLKNLAEVLAQEIRVAADRTETVSDVAAFAAKHFSNRFFNARRKEEPVHKSTADKTGAGATKKAAKERPPHVELCPDCFGSGFYNPDGKGIRSGCPHSHLAEKVAEMKAAGELA